MQGAQGGLGGLQLGTQTGSLGLGGLNVGGQTATSGLKLGGGQGTGLQLGGGGSGLQLGVGGSGVQLGGGGAGLQLGGGGSGLQLGGGVTGLQLGGGGSGLQLGGGGYGVQLGGGTGLQLGGKTQGAGLQLGLSQPIPAPLGLGQQQRGMSMGIFSQAGQSQTQSASQQALQTQLMINAVQAPGIHPDERDTTIMKFNLLQAYSGTGQGVASHLGQPGVVPLTAENPFCRFKTICYSRLPSSRNEEGLVALQFNKPNAVLLLEKDAVIKSLQSIVGTPGIQVMVDSVRPLPDNFSEMTIYMLEKSVMGGARHLLAGDVFMFLQNTTRKAQLGKIGVTGLYPKTSFTAENLQLYLHTPPEGISVQQWEESKKDNPDPQKYIPVPVIGSEGLLKRAKHQEQESKQHQSRLQIIAEEIVDLERSRATTMAKIIEHRRRLVQLSHRVLKVMVVQESLRKIGYSVQQDEEQLRVRLEAIQAELDAPLQFKGRLNELLSQIRMQTQVTGPGMDARGTLDPVLSEEIRQHLVQQHGALSQLVRVVKEDFEDLKCIQDGFTQT